MRLGLLSFAIAAVLSGVPAAAAVPQKAVTACMDTADAADKLPANCLGLILADCKKAPNADENACAAKELAFWSEQLGSVLKAATAAMSGYPELAKPQGDAQKAWLLFRDKACAIADKVDPGTMPGGSAWCRAEVTAERVFMLRRISASLGEH